MDDSSPRAANRFRTRTLSQAGCFSAFEARHGASDSRRRLLGWTLALTGGTAMAAGAALMAMSAF